MTRRWRYLLGAVFGAVVLGAAAAIVVLVLRAAEPPPPPPPPKFPRTEPPPHPVLPSSATERPAQAFCEVRDIHAVGSIVRRAQAETLAHAKRAPKGGERAECSARQENRAIVAVQNDLAGRTSACVARDSPLDNEWAQIESAVLALGQCADCTIARDKRLRACRRVLELTDSAQSTAKP